MRRDTPTMLAMRCILLSMLAFACGPGSETPAAEAIHQHQVSSKSEATVDLELNGAELTDALGMLAQQAQINLFADSHLDEAGRVTLTVHSQPWRSVLDRIAADHQLRIEQLRVRGPGRPAFWISRQSTPPAPRTSFVGDVITARFDDTPIRDVAKALSSVAKTNIVVDDAVDAKITLHMRLPWDLALYHLAQKYDLRIVQGEDQLRITRGAD